MARQVIHFFFVFVLGLGRICVLSKKDLLTKRGMIQKKHKTLLSIVFVSILWGQKFVESKNIAANDCPKDCVVADCPERVNCFAGIIYDHCNCCLVCARREGERCFNETFRSKVLQTYEQYEDCGEYLECRLRTDLGENDPPEAICYCKKEHPICGSDNITYENDCQFTEARYKLRKGLYKIDDAPCVTKPQIISKPEDLYDSIGESVSFICEAKGWPIPQIDWKLLQDGVEMPLPTDDTHVSVRSRGGPAEYGITSWLQISSAERRHSGNYICVARNIQGEERATAELLVGNFNKKSSITEANRMEGEL